MRWVFAFCIPLLLANSSEADERLAFFESKIRPVLIEHCYECHAIEETDEAGGSLWLDSSNGMMDGGDSGPAIVPGNVEASLLVSAMRYESTEMPPDGRLPDETIADFEKWIRDGAFDPRESDSIDRRKGHRIDIEAGKEFWSFKPIELQVFKTPPSHLEEDWIDVCIDDRLASAGITSSSLTRPDILLRRLCYDLTGLPPSLALQRRFESDPSEESYSQIVNELLSAPEFGQHWARHWMDVARYADSNGSDFNATYHEAYRYRDWLIEAFNADTPFDRMIRMQVAGDLLPAKTDSERYNNVVATTFLMLGTKMLSERDKAKLELDVVDEQVDTIGRGFMGLTMGCARCHDHKFDPIPTEDYYAMAGILAASMTLNGESQEYVSTFNRMRLPTSEQHREQRRQYNSELRKLESRRNAKKKEIQKLQEQLEAELEGVVVDDQQAIKTGKWTDSKIYRHYVGKGYVHDGNAGDGNASIRFEAELDPGIYEIRVAFSPGGTRASVVPVRVDTVDGTVDAVLNQQRVDIQPIWGTLGEFPLDESAAVMLANQGTKGYVIADAVQFIPVNRAPVIESSNAPESSEARDQARKEISNQLAAVEKQLAGIEKQLKTLKSDEPPALPEAMAPTDRPTDELANLAIRIRGEPHALGDEVPRGFLQVCGSGSARLESLEGSGRLELADWLTDPDHPLVARVWVNRVWQHLFGEGIVRTVDNFGTRGETPSHPELLDHLAAEMIQGKWRLKPMIRRLVMTKAYRRSSDYDANAAAVDPENRLLWRHSRKRLTAESIRDSMLTAAGQLRTEAWSDALRDQPVLASGNSASDKVKGSHLDKPYRSVYLPIIRGFVPDLMQSLDVANADLLVGRRSLTNVPGKPLAMMHHPSVIAWANASAKRIVNDSKSLEDRLELLYRRLLSRSATRQEYDFWRQVIEPSDTSEGLNGEVAWRLVCRSIFASTEFHNLD
ncbi:MAG: DUF1553 domain-containing protein [Planctomycetota bacterium]